MIKLLESLRQSNIFVVVVGSFDEKQRSGRSILIVVSVGSFERFALFRPAVSEDRDHPSLQKLLTLTLP